MATVTRTIRWFRYLSALLIAATFSLVGRSAPSWATDAKRDYAASVFRTEMDRPAKRASDDDKFALKPGLSGTPYDHDIRTLEKSIFESAEVRAKVRLRTLKKLKSIDFTGNPTTEELLLYNSELLLRRLDEMETRLDEMDAKAPAKK